jgi:Ferritin-like domain
MAPVSSNASTRGSRELFVKRALLAGGAVTVGAAGMGALPRLAASAPSPAQDVRILNLVLLLEYVESGLYAGARERGALRGELRDYVNVVGGHERQHLAAVKGALGSKARKQPRLVFGNAITDPDAFVAAAIDLEDLSVAAYNGQATNLTKPTLAVAAKIVSVEARHAAWIRAIAGKPPAADATDPSLTAAQVLAKLQKTGWIRA